MPVRTRLNAERIAAIAIDDCRNFNHSPPNIAILATLAISIRTQDPRNLGTRTPAPPEPEPRHPGTPEPLSLLFP